MSVQLELPIIGLPELESCEKGDCSMCGRCCIAFSVEQVPSEIGNVFSKKIHKAMGQPCPQLVQLDDGKFGCAVHEFKHLPELQGCAMFEGTRGAYHAVKDAMREVFFSADSKEEACRAIEYFRRGLAADIDLRIRNSSDFCGALKFVLRADELPHDLFAAMGLAEYVAQNPASALQWMNRIGMNPFSPIATDSERAFHEMYSKPYIAETDI